MDFIVIGCKTLLLIDILIINYIHISNKDIQRADILYNFFSISNKGTMLKVLLGICIIITISCTEIFKTDLQSIQDCTDDNDICSYGESIQPIFDMNCTRCHGDQGRLDGGLDLTSHITLMAGGNSNSQIIIEGDTENSLLWQRINSNNSPMPPAYDSPMIDDNYKDMISKWIQQGAKNN